MKTEIILKFKAMFEEQRRNLLYSDKIVDQNFEVAKEDMLDENDLTSSEVETSMRMRLRNREALFIKKIDEALLRIKDGSFGECEDCGEDIELRRLEARPTATFCVACKEASEHREQFHADGRKSKSLGFKLKLA
jgi:DnaK suppressor protein